MIFSRPLPLGPYVEGSCHSVCHTWNKSCCRAWMDIAHTVFWSSLQIYTPLYLVRRR